jgi:Cof subfamily protein (haloacid dehalogenase superfamily)
MIKLLALDIDGTILKQDYTLSPNAKKAVKKAVNVGIKVVLVTGRMHSATTFIAEELELDTPIITYSGALVQDSQRVFYENLISDSLVSRVLKELRAFDVQTNLYIDDEIFSEVETDTLIEYCEKRKLRYKIKSFDEFENIQANKILAIGKNPEATTEVLEYLQSKFPNDLCVVKSLPTFCEIISKDASKGKAILYLAKKWNINPDEIMAVGDQDNDIEMLKAANIKVAMGNATEGLKAVANYVAPSVEDDGVVDAIEKFIFKNQN